MLYSTIQTTTEVLSVIMECIAEEKNDKWVCSEKWKSSLERGFQSDTTKMQSTQLTLLADG